MTEEKKILVNEFRERFERLVSLCDRLRQDYDKAETNRKALEEKVKAQEEEYKQLKLRYDNIKTMFSLLKGDEKHDAKIYLNRIVREIDKCLKMLMEPGGSQTPAQFSQNN